VHARALTFRRREPPFRFLVGSLSAVARQAKLGVNLRTSSSLGTPTIGRYMTTTHSRWRIAGISRIWQAVKLVDRLTILVVDRWFPGMGAAEYRSLRSAIYVRMKELVHRSTFAPFRRFLARWCASGIHTTPFGGPLLWHTGIISSRRFARGQ
jgi:hypothetical protein